MQKFNQLFPSLNPVNGTGVIRTKPSDFKVTEHNELSFTGEGEHLWLLVKKTNSNTAWAATQLASACKVPARQVGFAGLKDRHAITKQWFSVQLPKIKELNEIKAKLPTELQIIDHQWHKSKIKTGYLSWNEFELVIRQVVADKTQIDQNIKTIKAQGVPNYFGAQRFGHNMNNIQQTQDWFSDRIKVNNKNLRSLLISTARSHIFNLILAARIKNNTWDQVLDGDILQLNKSHSWFPENQASQGELIQRLTDFDIHLTAALWGEDAVQSTAECAELESAIAAGFPIYQQGFDKFRVKQDRRAMRITATDLTHQWHEDHLHLKFKLLPGAYATSILKEILEVSDHQDSQLE